MRYFLTDIRNRARSFVCAEAASTLTTFALLAPVLIGAVGIGVDYARASLLKTKMQAIADSTAVMSARQLQLATATPGKVAAYAKSFIASQLNGVTSAVDVDANALTVRVRLTATVDRLLDVSLLGGNMPV